MKLLNENVGGKKHRLLTYKNVYFKYLTILYNEVA